MISDIIIDNLRTTLTPAPVGHSPFWRSEVGLQDL